MSEYFTRNFDKASGISHIELLKLLVSNSSSRRGIMPNNSYLGSGDEALVFSDIVFSAAAAAAV